MYTHKSTYILFSLIGALLLLTVLLPRVAQAQMDDPRAPGTSTQTFCSSPVLAIPDDDPTGVSDTLVISATGTIVDVNLVLSATHTYVGNLALTLTHNTADVTAFDRPGGGLCSGNNLPAITLDDDPGGMPGTPVETSCADDPNPAYTPSGVYTPDAPLSAFDGGEVNGTWTLTASDHAAADIGVLETWCVVVAYNSPPVANDDLGAGFTTDEDTAFTLAEVLANDTDPDGGLLSLVSFDDSPTLGLLNYTPNPGGALDPSFDGDGRVTTDFGDSAGGYGIILQPDGKILVAGLARSDGTYDFALARYLPDGSLDISFGGDGRVVTDFGNSNDVGYAIALQPDGRIIIGGTTNNGENIDFALSRYLPDGVLDTSFDGDGRVTTDFFGYGDSGRDVVLQSGGRILVAGGTWNGSDFDFALARYNPDGSLDTTFDSDGRVATSFFAGDEEGLAIALQPDDKMLVAGFTYAESGYYEFALARYRLDGSLFDYDPNGQFEWLAVGETATDTFTYVVSDGTLTDTATVSLTITGLNDTPVLSVIGSQSVDELVTLAFTATAMDVDRSDVLTFTLDVGAPAGASITPSGVFSWTPSEDQGSGVYTVAVRVTDSASPALSDAETITITVNEVNIPPIANAGLDQAAYEGQTLSFSGAYTDTGRLPVPTAIALAWDFGDGVTSSGVLTPTHTYLDDGVYIVTLVVTDEWGGVASDWLLAAVTNINPTLAYLADQSVVVGEAISLTAVYTDPGLLDTHTVVIDWGNGITETHDLPAGLSSFDFAQIYDVIGVYTVTLTLSDDDGGVDTATFQVNVAPACRLFLPLISKP